MKLTGEHFIAGHRTASTTDTFQAINPANSETLDVQFPEASKTEIDEALVAADGAYDALQTASSETIASLLEAIADGLESIGDVLLDRAHAETALPLARLTGERGRTCNQTRIFADMARKDLWRQPRIDQGDSQRKPPKPDVRTMLFGVCLLYTSPSPRDRG